MVGFRNAVLQVQTAGHELMIAERAIKVLRLESRASTASCGSSRTRSCSAAPAASPGPGCRRPASTAPSRTGRLWSPSSDSTSRAAAFPAAVDSHGPASSRTIAAASSTECPYRRRSPTAAMRRWAWPKTRCPAGRPHSTQVVSCTGPLAASLVAGWRHVRAEIARAGFHRGLLRIDQLAALRRVLFRQQSLFRNLAELRIAVIPVAIRKRQLHRFDHGVQILADCYGPSPSGRSLPGCSAPRSSPDPGSRSPACGPRSRDRCRYVAGSISALKSWPDPHMRSVRHSAR